MAGNTGIRVARNLPAAAVALIAVPSVLLTHGSTSGCGKRHEVTQALLSGVDGALVVATVIIVDTRGTPTGGAGGPRRGRRGSASLGRRRHRRRLTSLGASAVDAWPAVALLVVVEMLADSPASRQRGSASVRRQTHAGGETAGRPRAGGSYRRPPTAAGRRQRVTSASGTCRYSRPWRKLPSNRRRTLAARNFRHRTCHYSRRS